MPTAKKRRAKPRTDDKQLDRATVDKLARDMKAELGKGSNEVG